MNPNASAPLIPNAQSEIDQGDQLTIKDFMHAIRERARLVWFSAAVCTALAIVIMILKPPVYTATMILAPAPASSQKVPSSSSLSSTLSSVTSLVTGASPTASPVAPMDEFMQLILSPRVAQRVIDKDPTVLPTIFYKEWNPATKQWHPPHDPISLFVEGVYTIFGLPAWSPPSAQRLSQYLVTNLEITPVSTTSMQTIAFTFKSPQFATRLLTELRREGDKIVRDEAADVADKQIDYLQKKLDTTQQLDERQMLLGLLQTQVMTRMSINNNLPYAASTVQPAVSTDLPTGPNPFVWIAIGIVVGLLLGIFLALGAVLIWPEGMPSLKPGGILPASVRRAVVYVTGTVSERAQQRRSQTISGS